MRNAISVEDNDNGVELRLVVRTVRLFALLTGLLYLRVVAGDVLARNREGDLPLALALLLALLLVATAGLALAWRWEGLGGLIALGSGVGLALLDYPRYTENRWLAALLYSSPFIVTGGLCLLCRRRRAT